jgi:hypothetical protein
MPYRSIASALVLFALFIALALSGCTQIQKFKTGLYRVFDDPPPQSEIYKEGLKEQKALLANSLQLAARISQMTDEERKKMAVSLQQISRKKITPRDRLAIALLALYSDEETLPASSALSLLEYFDEKPTDLSPELRGLTTSLQKALTIIAEARKNFTTLHKTMQEALAGEKVESQKLQNELASERQKSKEMSQKLQQLLEIEKIMEKRK